LVRCTYARSELTPGHLHTGQIPASTLDQFIVQFVPMP
jgi:hypothetical protein